MTMAVGDKLTQAEERAIADYVSAKSYGLNAKHQPGSTLVYEAHTSASKSVYDENMDIQFGIQTKHGKDISVWNEKEQEILHKRGTVFYITGRDGNTIYMEEI